MSSAQPLPARCGDAEWKAELAQLRTCQRLIRQVARVLGLKPNSPRAQVLQEYLISEMFRLAFGNPKRPATLLQELHRALKAGPPDSPGRKKNATPEKKNLSEHLEQLYGPGVVVVEEVEDEEAPDKAR
ncbi:MAG: hypothetical protein ACE5IP_13075 [Terriglobia bacterium]